MNKLFVVNEQFIYTNFDPVKTNISKKYPIFYITVDILKDLIYLTDNRHVNNKKT
jgi:hypothetical protein